MTAATTSTRVDDLRAARARGEGSGELLDLADAAIRDAIAAHDAAALEAIADELDAEEARSSAERRGLAIAAAHARAAIAPTAPVAAPPAAHVPAEPSLTYARWIARVAAFAVDWTALIVFAAFVEAATGAVTAEAALLFYVVIPLAYFTALHAVSGRTLGKAVAGIAVRDSDGGAVPLGTAIRRSVAQVILVFIPLGFFVDSLWPLWDPRGQTLHDKAAGTVVVVAPRA